MCADLQDSFSLEASLLGSSGARQVMRDGRTTAFGPTFPGMSGSKPLVLPTTGKKPKQEACSSGCHILTGPCTDLSCGQGQSATCVHHKRHN